MNKNYLIIGAILVGVIILAGGFFLLNQNGSNEKLATEKSDSMNNTDEQAMMEGDEKMMSDSSSRYVVYNSNSSLETENNERRLLYFYANWCPTCRPVDSFLQENSDKIPEDLKIIRVNYNDTDTDQEEKDLAKKYSVTYQHTFVQIDENGTEIDKWNGGGFEEILTNIK